MSLQIPIDWLWDVRTGELAEHLSSSAPRLRSLEFYFHSRVCTDGYKYSVPKNFRLLSQLTSLSITSVNAHIPPEDLASVVQRLSSLQRLALSFGSFVGQRQAAADVADSHRRLLISLATSGTHLKELALSPTELASMPPELAALPGLTRLQLSGGLTSMPDSVSQLTSLRELDLLGNWQVPLPEGLASCLHLTRLELTSSIPNPVLGRLRSLRHLRVLALPTIYPYWTQLTELRELVLHCRAPGTFECSDLPAGPYLSRLESLTLGDLRVFPDNVLENLTAATQLRCLSLPAVLRLTPDDVAVLCDLPAFSCLRVRDQYSKNQGSWSRLLAQIRAAGSSRGSAITVSLMYRTT